MVTKGELKKYLRLFSKISNVAKKHSDVAYVSVSRVKCMIIIPKWFGEIFDILKSIHEYGDWIVKKVIEENYFKDSNKKNTMNNLPISEATYYRIKQQIVDKVYSLLILKGYVKKEEILND